MKTKDKNLPEFPEEVVSYNRSFPKVPTFKQTTFDQPVCKFGLPVITAYEDQWHVMGTCVMITPGLALTAKHVLEDCLKLYQGKDPSTLADGSEINGRFSMQAVQFLSGDNAVLWWVDKVHASALTDVAFLQMKPMFDNHKIQFPKKVGINLNAPALSSRVVAFGYPKSKVRVRSEKIECVIDPHTAVGEVVEVLQEGRGRGRAFPCFRTNARFDAGMSGGPVFDETGKLCGLICSNMPPFTHDEDHVSYVTLLWPCMETKLTMPRKHDPTAQPYPALELAKDNYIQAFGWEQVELSDTQEVVWKV